MKRSEMNRAPGLGLALVSCAVLLLLAALYFILPTRETSGAEQLSSFPAAKLSAFLSGEFQDDLEQALKDQFAIRDDAVRFTETIKAGEKDAYNSAENVCRGYSVADGLVPFGRVYRMNATDWLSNMVYTYDEQTETAYEKKAAQINALAERHPDVRFLVYYCSRAEDMHWFDRSEGVSSFSYSELLDRLLSDRIAFARTEFSDLHDYSLKMYKTDHHWNAYGAWTAYQTILDGLCLPGLGQARRTTGEKTFGGLTWQGSRYRECGVTIPKERRDKFTVYTFDLPEYTTYYGDSKASLGLAEDYDAGNIVSDESFDQYLNYFGFEAEPITLDFGKQSGLNLLIIGDSFTRALRAPLASHFDKTVYLNFRILDGVNIDKLIEECDIDAVLLMGQQDAWSGYFFDEGATA